VRRGLLLVTGVATILNVVAAVPDPALRPTRMRSMKILTIALLTVLGTIASAPGVRGDDEGNAPTSPMTVVKEHRYRMSAAIRPLLFWIGDSDVGGARIVWRQGPDGSRGFEFLLGSDPDRAPRRINRWGWVREDVGASSATQIGLMRRTDEETVEQARAHVGFEGQYVFKVIRTRVTGRTARAENTVWLVRSDYTYYDLPEVLRIVSGPPQAPPRVNEALLPPGTEPGFLVAVYDLVDRAVAAATRTPRELLRDVTTRFNFNAVAYELRLRSTEWEESKEYGSRTFERLVRVNFESYNPTLRTTERFTLACGTEGALRGIPVYVKYQPKWWFKAEGVLDESQSLEKAGHPPAALGGRDEKAPSADGTPGEPGRTE
jgi:hypothetical protein